LKWPIEEKYALVGYFSKHYQFQAVKLVKDKNENCYQMYPNEGELFPKPLYYVFASALASSLYEGVSLLQAHGFVAVFQTANDFRESLSALSYTRPLIARYEKVITEKDFRDKRLKENLITLGNIKSVLNLGLIIIISASVSFVAEVYSKEVVEMMLIHRITLRYS